MVSPMTIMLQGLVSKQTCSQTPLHSCKLHSMSPISGRPSSHAVHTPQPGLPERRWHWRPSRAPAMVQGWEEDEEGDVEGDGVGVGRQVREEGRQVTVPLKRA
jgi:hypothetical protein